MRQPDNLNNLFEYIDKKQTIETMFFEYIMRQLDNLNNLFKYVNRQPNNLNNMIWIY